MKSKTLGTELKFLFEHNWGHPLINRYFDFIAFGINQARKSKNHATSRYLFHMLGDGPYYQAFAEKIASGIVDFTIVGCHGQSFLASLVYLTTNSK